MCHIFFLFKAEWYYFLCERMCVFMGSRGAALHVSALISAHEAEVQLWVWEHSSGHMWQQRRMEGAMLYQSVYSFETGSLTKINLELGWALKIPKWFSCFHLSPVSVHVCVGVTETWMATPAPNIGAGIHMLLFTPVLAQQALFPTEPALGYFIRQKTVEPRMTWLSLHHYLQGTGFPSMCHHSARQLSIHPFTVTLSIHPSTCDTQMWALLIYSSSVSSVYKYTAECLSPTLLSGTSGFKIHSQGFGNWKQSPVLPDRDITKWQWHTVFPPQTLGSPGLFCPV